MSSVGFVPGTVKELETLREAWKTLNDLLRNLASAEASLQKHDLQLTAVHLKVAKWNAGQAKKAIAAGAKPKTKRPTVKPASRIGGYLPNLSFWPSLNRMNVKLSRVLFWKNKFLSLHAIDLMTMMPATRSTRFHSRQLFQTSQL